MVAVGTRIQRFEVTAHLGTGGMGAVFRARDPQLERDVAIKLLTRPSAGVPPLSAHETVDLRTDAPATADDLLREARMMARLSHPNVLPVYEVGLVDDAVFVVMECIDGADLRTWLAEPRTTTAILDVFAQAGRGLAAAHAREIVHRDFKPENVLVGNDQRVRVADFGLSRLAARPTHSMRRTDADHGTPRYMAPELWRGDAASKQSDVFAFCVALGEAFGAEPGEQFEKVLRDRDVAPALRSALVAGVSDSPDARPTLAALLLTIEGRSAARPRRRAIVLGGVAALGITGAVVALAATANEASCDVDSGLAAGRWDGVRRTALVVALQPDKPASWSRDAIGKIVALLDEAQNEIEVEWRATCAAEHNGTLTQIQADGRRSCIERRAFELAARVDQLAVPGGDLNTKLDRARGAAARDCLDLSAPPIKGDHAAVAALYRRLMEIEASPMTAARIAPLATLAQDAAAHGESELEARALLVTGITQRETDQLKAADETLQRAYKIYLDIHSLRGQALVLVHRGRTASRRSEQREAMSMAQLALELVEREKISPAATALVYHDAGRATNERGDPKAAVALFDKGLAAIAADHHRLPGLEAGIRIERTRTLGMIEGTKEATLTASRETVEWIRTTFGETSQLYSSALDVYAATLQRWGNIVEALPVSKQALDVMIASSAPGDARIDMARGNYAGMLETAGIFDEALVLYKQELAAAEHNETLAGFLPLLTVRVGALTCKVGRCAEGMPLIERGVELGTAKYGLDHAYTQQYRTQQLNIQLNLDQLDAAARTIAKLDASYRTKKADNIRSIVYLHGALEAELALRRGNFRQAEKLAREALASWDELKADDGSRAAFLERLGAALIEQRKWTEAETVLTKALQVLKAAGSRDHEQALVEIDLARVEAGQGKTAEAISRVRRARAVIEHRPLAIEERRRADLVLALANRAPTARRPRAR